MVKIYYELIKKGLWKIESVPTTWKGDVQKLLDEDMK